MPDTPDTETATGRAVHGDGGAKERQYRQYAGSAPARRHSRRARIPRVVRNALIADARSGPGANLPELAARHGVSERAAFNTLRNFAGWAVARYARDGGEPPAPFDVNQHIPLSRETPLPPGAVWAVGPDWSDAVPAGFARLPKRLREAVVYLVVACHDHVAALATGGFVLNRWRIATADDVMRRARCNGWSDAWWAVHGAAVMQCGVGVRAVGGERQA